MKPGDLVRTIVALYRLKHEGRGKNESMTSGHIRALVDAISILDRLPPDEVTAILKRSVVAAYPGADEGDLYELRELRKSEDEAKALAELVRPKTWDEIHEEQDRERDED
jgi:hypothetical protein